MVVFVFIFLATLFPQSIADYKKMLDEALSQQALQQHQSFDIRIERVVGGVEVVSMEEEVAKLTDNYQYPLEVEDIVKTAYDGEANVYIDNFGILHITKNTEIEILETQGELIIFLKHGGLVGRVEKSKNKSLFKIKTPSGLSLIRQGQFAVEHNKLLNESVFGVIDEGEMDLFPGGEENENNSYKVLKNQEMLINPSSKRYKLTSLSKLSRYRSKIPLIKKSISQHKRKWRYFTSHERFKYRQALFNKKKKNIKRQVKTK